MDKIKAGQSKKEIFLKIASVRAKEKTSLRRLFQSSEAEKRQRAGRNPLIPVSIKGGESVPESRVFKRLNRSFFTSTL